ncbi:hypothetical protein V6N13_107484 [Hibiscus sabdariffa]|uniref:Uncharacterized protein n=1 Tax=Hibiscus sabdariffa TaxID=183260 RepID=A0ABR2SQ17_9ROSI
MDLVQLAAVFSRTNQTTRQRSSFSNMVHTMILASGFRFLSMLEPEPEPVSFMGSNTETNVPCECYQGSEWDLRRFIGFTKTPFLHSRVANLTSIHALN